MKASRMNDRKVIAMSRAVHSGYPLHYFKVSSDQLTASPSLTPEDFPMTLEAICASGYDVIKWDGRCVLQYCPVPS